MERYLKPERLDFDPSMKMVEKLWRHWHQSFSNFLAALDASDQSPNKLSVLVNYVTPRVYEYIANCTTYEDAITLLKDLYIKPTNAVFSRHLLATRKQESSESLDQYLNVLKQLSKDCQYVSVTASLYREESIRDSFITGLQSAYIRQRLLENSTLTLQNAFDQARSLDMARQHAGSYGDNSSFVTTASTSTINPTSSHSLPESDASCSAAVTKTPTTTRTCYFCGFSGHPRSRCPARDSNCNLCSKPGHFAKVCKSKHSPTTAATESSIVLGAMTTSAAAPGCLAHALLPITINGKTTKALVDTGSSESFINLQFAKRLCLKMVSSGSDPRISMATTDIMAQALGCFSCYIAHTEGFMCRCHIRP